MSVYVNINYIFIIYLVNHGLWQYRTGSTMRARTVNIRFLWLLTVRAHGQYNHRSGKLFHRVLTIGKGKFTKIIPGNSLLRC